MLKFIKNIIKDFCNIYLDEKNIRESYGDEYADRFSSVDPATGRKKISVSKILNRILIVFIIIFCLIVIIRMATYKGDIALW